MPWKRAPNCATGPFRWETTNIDSLSHHSIGARVKDSASPGYLVCSINHYAAKSWSLSCDPNRVGLHPTMSQMRKLHRSVPVAFALILGLTSTSCLYTKRAILRRGKPVTAATAPKLLDSSLDGLTARITNLCNAVNSFQATVEMTPSVGSVYKGTRSPKSKTSAVSSCSASPTTSRSSASFRSSAPPSSIWCPTGIISKLSPAH